MRLILIVICLVLNGCSVHKANFDCPNNKGMGCKSMTDVYDSIHNKSFGNGIRNAAKASCLECNQSSLPVNNDKSTKHEQITNIALKASEPVVRAPEKVLRIWFNGHYDEQNNFRGSQYVYTVLEPAKWLAK
jgi:type IV conjugative transfer system lipoprotein TraV